MARKRRRNLPQLAGGALLLLIAGLSFAAFAKPDGEAVREELRREVDRFHKMPRQEPALQVACLQELLANEDYVKYGASLLVPLRRMLGPLQALADLQREAHREVPPFILGCSGLARMDLQELRAAVDQANSMSARFAPTSYGEELHALWEKLRARQAALEEVIDCPPVKWQELVRSVTRAAEEGDHVRATAEIRTFCRKHGVEDIPLLSRKVAELKEMLDRRSIAFVEKLIERCRDLPKAEAKALLEAALAKMKGAPGEWKLQAALFALR